jgi:signal transduction histidine kinase
MKRFVRTIPGKATAFLLCILSLCLAAACAAGAVIMAQSGFYTRSESALVQEYVGDNIHSKAYDFVWNAAWDNEIPETDPSVAYFLYDPYGDLFAVNEAGRSYLESGETLESTDALQTEGAAAVGNNEWVWYYEIKRTDSGEVIDVIPLGTEPLGAAEAYQLRVVLMEGSGIEQFLQQLIHFSYRLRYGVYPIGILAVLLSLSCFITLMCVSARRPDSDELHPGPLYRVPTDVLTAAVFLPLVLGGVWVDQAGIGDTPTAGVIIFLCLLTVNLLLGLCMSVAGRIKGRTLFRNTLIWKLCVLLWRILRGIWRGTAALVRGIPLVWRTALALLILTLVEAIVFFQGLYDNGAMTFWFMEHVILIPLLLLMALMLRRLQRGGVALAEGDLSYQVDTRHMIGDFRRHGENLNSIAGGMVRAVDQRMKSERLKTELITNVSHDIKTPLTSIINYADLIGREPCDNEKITEYAAVLLRQSERLKRLIEDLVEASKASTGNLEVLLAPCEAGVMLTQAAGEYEQRLEAAGLELVTRAPEEPVHIMADGRRLWRVFDNLMSNACKYAQQGTRVYLTLEEEEGQAVITFRNTSRAALNLSPEELMERFVRGDTSRNTEGNGLGLSIARSLTELQGGTMELSIDGDLFKVILRFPVIG